MRKQSKFDENDDGDGNDDGDENDDGDGDMMPVRKRGECLLSILRQRVSC